MTTTSPPGSIVVGYDGSHHADQALLWAAQQAHLEARTLTLVHVITEITALELGGMATVNLIPAEVRETVRAGGRLLALEARNRVLDAHPMLDVVTILGEGDPRRILLTHSRQASCLVLGSRGRGRMTSLLLGSVSVALTRHATCPVVVVRPHHPGVVRRGVLVGTDCTEHTASTLEFAYRQASLRRLPLTVLHCISYADHPALMPGMMDDDSSGFDDQRRMLSEAVAGMTEKFPDVTVSLRLGHGRVEHCMIDASVAMDLVVVGHHVSSVADVFGLGSYAPVVVEGASCPVAVVIETHHA